jgi:hypothetical protein
METRTVRGVPRAELTAEQIAARKAVKSEHDRTRQADAKNAADLYLTNRDAVPDGDASLDGVPTETPVVTKKLRPGQRCTDLVDAGRQYPVVSWTRASGGDEVPVWLRGLLFPMTADQKMSKVLGWNVAYDTGSREWLVSRRDASLFRAHYYSIVHNKFSEQAKEAGIDYATSVTAQAVIDHTVNGWSFRALGCDMMRLFFEAQGFRVSRQDLSELVCSARREESSKAFQEKVDANGGPLRAILGQEFLPRILYSEGGSSLRQRCDTAISRAHLPSAGTH